MSDMWTVITIRDPQTVTLDNLPDELEYLDGEDSREPVSIPGRPQWDKPGDPDGSITLSGGSNYGLDEARTAARELSKKTGRITFYEEWSGDGYPTKQITVYENGETATEYGAHDEMVPDNWTSLLWNLRVALATSIPSDRQKLGAVMRAAQDLISAIDRVSEVK